MAWSIYCNILQKNNNNVGDTLMLNKALISKSISLILLVFFINLSFLPSAKAQACEGKASSPMCVVKFAVNQILDILQDQKLSKEERREKIRKIIYEHFDFSEMAKRILARHWRKLSPEERKTFTDLLAKLLETSYRNKIESYSGEKILFKKERIRRNLARVYTIIQTKKESIPVTYSLLKKKNGKWVIYDVKVEDVSMVSNYRATYAEIIKREGFDGLIAKMKAKIEELSSKSEEKSAAVFFLDRKVVLL